MDKVKFTILFLCVLSAGFYFGSREDTYAYKFFAEPINRFPANESAKSIQKMWDLGQISSIETGSDVSKVYSPLSKPDQNICDFYQDIKSLKVNMLAEASVSDSQVSLVAEIDCNRSGSSPLFLKSFCSEALSYFQEDQIVLNTVFRFENILDGFPRSWYIESADILLKDGLAIIGVKPSSSDVRAYGKYAFECSRF